MAPAPVAAAPVARQSPSRAESKAKSDQAEAMLLSGAAREALDLCESAVEVDPRNLHAHLVGARASRILRDGARETEFLEGTIKLLRSEEYASDSQWYHEVLKHARNPTLTSQVARAFVAARTWPAADALPMVRALVGRGAVADALIVLDSLPPSDRSLLTCAYSMQLTGGAFARLDPDLQVYLGGTPAARRGQILAELLEVQAADVIAGSTISRVREAVRSRYELWVPDIERLIGEEARTVATARIAPKVNGPAAGWAIRFFLGALVLVVILAVAFGGSAPVLGLGAVVALGCAGAGFAYGRDVETKKFLPTVLPEVKEELAEREVQRWGSILTDDHGAAFDGPAAASATETCPYCGANVSVSASTCPQCSRARQLESPDAAPADGAAEAAQPEPDPGKPAEAGSPTEPGGAAGGGTPETSSS